MRGKDTAVNRKCIAVGITPAYAGKRCRGQCSSSPSRDHPRVCGEKVQLLPDLCFHKGSPPRMRGKVIPASALAFSSGITPAYAGKSGTRSLPAGRQGDHPRVCGEKVLVAGVSYTGTGSPPRMRGKASRSCWYIFRVGITPAYAGKSIDTRVIFADYWDHPRVCGEKEQMNAEGASIEGSPPRMRGKD